MQSARRPRYLSKVFRLVSQEAMAYLMRNGMKISHHAFSQSSIAGCSGLDRYNEQWPDTLEKYYEF